MGERVKTGNMNLLIEHPPEAWAAETSVYDRQEWEFLAAGGRFHLRARYALVLSVRAVGLIRAAKETPAPSLPACSTRKIVSVPTVLHQRRLMRFCLL